MGYHQSLVAARNRLDAAPRHSVHSTRSGAIEYADHGDGAPVLVSHPLLGGFDIGINTGRAYIGGGFRLIAPSRFGYLGSTLPAGATPAGQADAFAELLDVLDLDTVPVFGYSAGGPAAIQLALRHPQRVAALVLLASALPGPAGRPPKPVPGCCSATRSSGSSATPGQRWPHESSACRSSSGRPATSGT